jgi:hypothetical protein
MCNEWQTGEVSKRMCKHIFKDIYNLKLLHGSQNITCKSPGQVVKGLAQNYGEGRNLKM